jgi:hypothetical protein
VGKGCVRGAGVAALAIGLLQPVAPAAGPVARAWVGEIGPSTAYGATIRRPSATIVVAGAWASASFVGDAGARQGARCGVRFRLGSSLGVVRYYRVITGSRRGQRVDHTPCALHGSVAMRTIASGARLRVDFGVTTGAGLFQGARDMGGYLALAPSSA